MRYRFAILICIDIILMFAIPIFASSSIINSETRSINIAFNSSIAVEQIRLIITDNEKVFIGLPEELKAVDSNPTFIENSSNQTLEINSSKYRMLYNAKIGLVKFKIWLYENLNTSQLSFPIKNFNTSITENEGNIEFLNEKSEPFAYIEQPFWQYNETMRNTKEYIRFSYNDTHLILSAEPKGFCFNQYPCYIDPVFRVQSSGNAVLRVWSNVFLNSTNFGNVSANNTLMSFNLTQQPNETASLVSSYFNYTYLAFIFNLTNFRPAVWNTTFCDNLTATFRKGTNKITTTGATNFATADWVYVFDQPYGNVQGDMGNFNETVYQKFRMKSFDGTNVNVFENVDETFFKSRNPVICDMSKTNITITWIALNTTDYRNLKGMSNYTDTIYWAWGDFLAKTSVKFSWVNISGITFNGLNGSFIIVEGIDKYTLHIDDLRNDTYNYTSCSFGNNSCDFTFDDSINIGNINFAKDTSNADRPMVFICEDTINMWRPETRRNASRNIKHAFIFNSKAYNLFGTTGQKETKNKQCNMNVFSNGTYNIPSSPIEMNGEYCIIKDTTFNFVSLDGPTRVNGSDTIQACSSVTSNIPKFPLIENIKWGGDVELMTVGGLSGFTITEDSSSNIKLKRLTGNKLSLWGTVDYATDINLGEGNMYDILTNSSNNNAKAILNSVWWNTKIYNIKIKQ